MRIDRIITDTFQFLNILKLESAMEFNEHGYLTMTGLISSERAHDYMEQSRTETWVRVSVKDENNKGAVFFHGIMTNFNLEKQGSAYLLTLELKTGTFLFDTVSHTRSFQEASFTWQDIIRACLNEDDGFISREPEGRQTGQFIMQYQETDWAFFKRLANNLGSVLLPYSVLRGRFFYLGCSTLGKTETISDEEYVLVKDYQSHHDRVNHMSNMIAKEPGIYQVRSREIYQLGTAVLFQGMNLRIGKAVSRLKGGELWHTYDLVALKEQAAVKMYNAALQGLSLEARVTAVEKNKVKVSIDQDENKRNCGSRWFDYATVYSTPDGTGWYCMPETGDQVRLIFNDKEEQSAHVISSVHLGTDGGRTNPDEKSWKNKQNKEILFTPESLILRNNNGLSVELVDGEGIKIRSNKDILLEADGEMVIKSENAGITVSASDKIALSQGAASIRMEDDINISGGKINMN